MNKTTPTAVHHKGLLFLMGSALLLASGCKKTYDAPSAVGSQQEEKQEKKGEGKKTGHFNQVHLVANTTGYNAAHTDPTLVNGWGIAFSPGGIAWVSSQAGHVSDVYDGEGAALAFSPVHIPSPGSNEGGNPTGAVFNPTTEFVLPTGGPARFIFVGLDGVLSAWNGAQGNHAFRKLTVPQSVFTGLTTGNNAGTNLLYAANFAAGKINVWDGNWNPVTLPFMDADLPAGYSPFNIQNIGGWLYVTYAKVASNGEEEAGIGKGFVDIYRTDGTLVNRFASGGTLNAPWGLTMAPPTWVKTIMQEEDDAAGQSANGAILVGNFGDGRINAYSPDGKFLGLLRGPEGHALSIEGLWAIMFPPATSALDPTRLYFAAGPDDETHGLFGYIVPRQE